MVTFPNETISSTTFGWWVLAGDAFTLSTRAACHVDCRAPWSLQQSFPLHGQTSAGVWAGFSGFQLPGRGRRHGRSGPGIARAVKGLCEQATATW